MNPIYCSSSISTRRAIHLRECRCWFRSNRGVMSAARDALHEMPPLFDVREAAQHDHDAGIPFDEGLAAVNIRGGGLVTINEEYALARAELRLNGIADGLGSQIVAVDVTTEVIN